MSANSDVLTSGLPFGGTLRVVTEMSIRYIIKRNLKRCGFGAHAQFKPRWGRERAARRESTSLAKPHSCPWPSVFLQSSRYPICGTASPLLWPGSLTLKIFLPKLNDPSQGIWQIFVTQKNNFQLANPLKLSYDILAWSFCWLFLSQVLHVGQSW